MTYITAYYSWETYALPVTNDKRLVFSKKELYFYSFLDINECMEGENNCTGTCVNAYGSYTCLCNDKGFVTSEDGTTCEGIFVIFQVFFLHSLKLVPISNICHPYDLNGRSD